MTERSMAVGMFLALYAAVAACTALFAAGLVTWLTDGGAPVLLTVFVVLCTVGVWAGGKLLSVVTRAWDALWDADGQSWAVREAEQAVQRAGEQR